MKHELISFMFYLVSQATVFRMSRNPPPKEGALRDIQKTAERETMFYLSRVQSSPYFVICLLWRVFGFFVVGGSFGNRQLRKLSSYYIFLNLRPTFSSFLYLFLNNLENWLRWASHSTLQSCIILRCKRLTFLLFVNCFLREKNAYLHSNLPKARLTSKAILKGLLEHGEQKSSSTVEISHPFLGLLILGSGGFFSHVRREVLSGWHVFEGQRPKARAVKGREKMFSPF